MYNSTIPGLGNLMRKAYTYNLNSEFFQKEHFFHMNMSSCILEHPNYNTYLKDWVAYSKSENLFLTVLEAGSPRSKCWLLQ